MKRPDARLLGGILSRYGLVESDIEYLGGGDESSDGILYACARCGERFALKLVSLKPGDAAAHERARLRMELARRLGQCGVCVACPREEPLFTEGGSADYMSFTMRLSEGHSPAPDELTPTVLEEWGALVGRAHAAAQSCEIWRALPGGEFEYGWQEEARGFRDMACDDYTRALWDSIFEQLDAIEPGRTNFGFTQNDNHAGNILLEPDGLTLIDFDVANCHFFASDIATMPQSLYFGVCGGFDRPISDAGIPLRAMENFLRGYERENHLSDADAARLDMFTQYRRILMYTVFADWVNSSKERRDSWRRQIEAPECIYGRLMRA